jgi:hypothetical protein
LRCPEVTTVSYDLSPQAQIVSGLAVMQDRPGTDIGR